MDQIIDKAYQGLVNKASPTGLLPIWNKCVDKKVVKQYGFSYNLGEGEGAPGRRRLQGHERRRVRREQGRLADRPEIVCPNGWSDWMTAIQVIADSAKAAGIKITPAFPEYGTMADDRGHGNYDLLLGNDRQYSNTPWTYYQYIFQLPITKNQTTVNYERYTNQTAWNLAKPLDKTPTTNTRAYQAAMSKLQTIFMQDLPAIPLWYNGMWSMVNTQYWTNWPSSTAASTRPPPGGTTGR